MKSCLLLAVLSLFTIGARAESSHPVITLWPGGAPGAQGTAADDIPTLTVYKPARKTNSTAVVVLPGGGYVHLAFDYEGTAVGEWLNGHGATAFILRYRLGPKYHYPIQLWDAQRAIRYVRLHSGEYGVDPGKIGVWGFSAGGHLASTAGTHFDKGDQAASDPIERQSSRPGFMILAYPVVSLEDPYVHLGSLHALLGDSPDPGLVRLLSNETQVTVNTPPTFLFHTSEDQTVPVENSVLLYLALRKARVPVEMHIYQKGHHGVGLAISDPVLKSWPDRLADWLRVQDLL